MQTTVLRTCVIVILAVIVAATGVAAESVAETAESIVIQSQPARDWSLRFGFLVSSTTGDSDVVVEPGSVDLSLNGGGGGFVSLERRVTPLLGVEFGLVGMGADMDISTGRGNKQCCHTDVDVLSIGSLTLGANFHLVDDGTIDVYAGPLVAFNRYADLSVRTGVEWPFGDDEWTMIRTRSDSEVTWGGKIGIDIGLGKKKKWAVGGSLTYIDASYDFERNPDDGRAEIEIDPLIFSFGMAYRF